METKKEIYLKPEIEFIDLECVEVLAMSSGSDVNIDGVIDSEDDVPAYAPKSFWK